MKVYLPYPKSLITQKFGANANYSYVRDGLKGHTAYDWGAPWGAAIPNCTPNAYCYSRMHENDPVLMDYRAVFFIVEDETGVYEVSYGHLSSFVAEVGKTYSVGDTIGYVGNTGDVFSGDHEVTEAEKQTGSHSGAHLHGPQIRPVKKVKNRSRDKHYLQDSNGFLYKDGFYFEVIDYDNGYNGCVSLATFSTETLATDYKKNIEGATKIVSAASNAVQKIATLPVNERTPFITSLKSILEGLSKLF